MVELYINDAFICRTEALKVYEIITNLKAEIQRVLRIGDLVRIYVNAI